MSSNNVVKLMDEIIESKIKENNEIIEDSEKRNKIKRLFINIIITFIITYLYCKLIRAPYINEKVSYNNPNAFPFKNLIIEFPNKIKVYCLLCFHFSNGKRIVKDITKNITTRPAYIKVGEFLKINPFILNKNETFFIAFKIDEKNYTRLLDQRITIHNPIYSINSTNEINETFQQKFYYLENEINLSNKKEEIKKYNYFIESHSIKKGDEVKKFAFIGDNEIVRELPWDYFNPHFNFVIRFIKGNILNQQEIIITPFYEIFFIIIGSVEFVIEYFPIFIKLIFGRKNEYSFKYSNEQRITLLMNEISHQNNSIINDLNNQNI